MSILFYVLAFLACVATAAGGAWLMRWHIQRTRDVSVREDPRDSQIRNLQAQINLLKKDSARTQSGTAAAEDHIRLAHERIEELALRSKKLTHELGVSEASIAQVHADKDLMRDKLSVANQQLETLKTRNQELECELNLNRDADLLDPHQQATSQDQNEEADLDALSAPSYDETSPSLLHTLSSELDRWKRHCRVLGDELKLQRERLEQMGADTDNDADVNPFDSIDELTDIRGIGNVIARKLHQMGIYRYKELISLSDDDLERAQMLIPDFERRMNRDSWQDQARELHRDKYSEAL